MSATRDEMMQALGAALAARHYDVAERIMIHLGLSLNEKGEILNERGEGIGIWYANGPLKRRDGRD